MGNIALGRESQAFVVPEVVAGTIVEPGATDLVLSVTTPQVVQERENFPDEQIRNTRSKLSPIAGRYKAGTWSFQTYIKPVSAGVAPAEDDLLTGLLGTKTSDATSVTYTPSASDPASYSLWFKDGHTVYMCSGCTVDKGIFRINGKDPGKAEWSGGLMKMLHTGTDVLGAAITDTTSTSITPTDVKLFSVGSIFTVDSERMKVTAVGVSTLTVTRGYGGTSPATHLISVTMTPWLPTGTESGNIVHGRLGICTLDAVNYTVLTTEVTITNGIKYYEEEMNNQDYATDFGVPVPRNVEGKITLYFRKGDAARFADAKDFNSLAVIIPLGNVTGKICTITLAQAKIAAPNITGDTERVQELTLMPFATSSYNDEISIKYT